MRLDTFASRQPLPSYPGKHHHASSKTPSAHTYRLLVFKEHSLIRLSTFTPVPPVCCVAALAAEKRDYDQHHTLRQQVFAAHPSFLSTRDARPACLSRFIQLRFMCRASRLSSPLSEAKERNSSALFLSTQEHGQKKFPAALAARHSIVIDCQRTSFTSGS